MSGESHGDYRNSGSYKRLRGRVDELEQQLMDNVPESMRDTLEEYAEAYEQLMRLTNFYEHMEGCRLARAESGDDKGIFTVK